MPSDEQSKAEMGTIYQKPIEIVSSDGSFMLRQHSLTDVDALFALIDKNRTHLSKFGDTTAIKYQTRHDVENKVLHPNLNRLRLGIWNARGQLVGSINLTKDDENPDEAEIGYWLGEEFTGHGYATRSVRLLTDYGFTQLGYKSVYGEVAYGNDDSAMVLKNAGYSETGMDNGMVVYTIIK